jgi:hypothetical protein
MDSRLVLLRAATCAVEGWYIWSIRSNSRISERIDPEATGSGSAPTLRFRLLSPDTVVAQL